MLRDHWFIFCLCVITVAAHIGTMFLRGWLIAETRTEQRKQRVEWERWKYDMEQWKKDFEETHPTWMIKKRTA